MVEGSEHEYFGELSLLVMAAVSNNCYTIDL